MAECVSPILDIVTRLWDCTANRVVYTCDLQDNLNSQRDLKRELENISKDVAEQHQYPACTNQVKGWLESVQHKLKAVDNILQKGDEEIQQKCLGSCCPRHCCTTYKLGKQVNKEIDVVTKLIEKGSPHVDVDKVLQLKIDEMPMEKTVGMESSLDEVWKCVENHEVRIIGLYGMGGVGKTTLLKELNNRFLKKSHNFDVVIWVVVSKEVKLDKIQETIRSKLHISDEIWKNKNEDERAAQILGRLRNKRFVLLLDDLWDRMELSKLGVSCSNNQNGYKIVFTTRSEEVCDQMGAKKRFKLKGLPQEAALRLFRQNVGEDVLNSHHELPKLAEIVAQKCDGLPLALVTIGRAMASRTTPEDWRGGFIIKSLKLSCLLEGSRNEHISYEEDHVKMHDVLRDMAHWLAREHGNEILVQEHAGLINSQGIDRWKETVRVSLCGDSTLFQSIHTLAVLNLSNNRNLRELPVEIGALISLHYLNLSKTCVSNLPIEVKNLTQLRILLLDKMMTEQVVIPPGVISSLLSLEMYSNINYRKQCKMDMKLMIEELECSEKITDVGLTFSSVSPVLKFMSSSPKLQSCITRLLIQNCEELCSLDISCSTMRRMEHLEKLYIRFCPNLREVKICFENGERMHRSEPNCFCNLQILNIWDCAMENLSWLRYTPRLRFLYVMECKSLEEIIAWDFAASSEIEEAAEIFSNLEQIHFDDLPKLKSIFILMIYQS
ncbi:hypothetical protein EZV62_004173 [Acer yangbiense]|uniref:Uncharacterized protein n=1 Tax=Acer yangbiense TaxID=1000413 RepID=A0A5C7IJB5_9ROSI|nr:hypothetical protein EZV62_004173 [Acer yangbiense]